MAIILLKLRNLERFLEFSIIFEDFGVILSDFRVFKYFRADFYRFLRPNFHQKYLCFEITKFSDFSLRFFKQENCIFGKISAFLIEPMMALSRNAVLMSVHYIHSRLILKILFGVL